MDRQPRLPNGGTIGTGNTSRLIERGRDFHKKVCSLCGTNFTLALDAFDKVYKPERDIRGQEVPAKWYAMTRQTRINGTSEYITPRDMLQMEAAAYFEKLLAARNIATKAIDSRTILVSMFRKVKLDADAFDLCRKCNTRNVNAKAKQWRAEKILTRRNGKIVNILEPNKHKDLPKKFARATSAGVDRKRTVKVEEDEVRIWSCYFAAIRGLPGLVMRTDKPMTYTEARAWFREHSGRGNLSGCSVY